MLANLGTSPSHVKRLVLRLWTHILGRGSLMGHSKSRNEEMRNEKWGMGKWKAGTLHFTQQTDVLFLQSSLPDGWHISLMWPHETIGT